MKKIVIASACRTAIGKFGGTLANVPAAELGSIVIKEALNRANVKPEQVDHVYMGCVIQAGLGQNVARQASLKAGLPIETPAVTVNVVCGSGLNCVNMAAQMIEAGDADIVVAGGMENMDMAPFAMMKGRYGYRMGYPMGKSELVDTMVNDALWDATGYNMHMGMTAENVCTNETYQKKYGYSPITREQLDAFAYHSQEKAAKAITDGAFKDEIVPVVIKGKMCIRDRYQHDTWQALSISVYGDWRQQHMKENWVYRRGDLYLAKKNDASRLWYGEYEGNAILSNPCNRSAGTAGFLICKNARGTVPEGTAVSYTHLDVYKRQDPGLPFEEKVKLYHMQMLG